jgi:hypothetical protein
LVLGTTLAVLAGFLSQLTPAEPDWMEFGLSPDASAVVEGAALARDKPFAPFENLIGDGIDQSEVIEVPGRYRRPIGQWSNGQRKVAVEWATWMSPELLSRWLGFLAEREHWPAGRVQERWNLVTPDLRGRILLVVELTAYPKLKTFGFGNYREPDPSTIRELEFHLTAGSWQVKPEVVSHEEWEARERHQVEAYRWWLQLGFGRALAPQFEAEQATKPLPFGDYHRAWYVLVVDQPPVDVDEFTLRVLNRNKERTATFSKGLFEQD